MVEVGSGSGDGGPLLSECPADTGDCGDNGGGGIRGGDGGGGGGNHRGSVHAERGALRARTNKQPPASPVDTRKTTGQNQQQNREVVDGPQGRRKGHSMWIARPEQISCAAATEAATVTATSTVG